MNPAVSCCPTLEARDAGLASAEARPAGDARGHRGLRAFVLRGSIRRCASLGTFALLALTGCAQVSPERVNVDRMDYGQVIAESWKRQTLLNVVRLRYADAPVFLDVGSIINTYSVAGKVSGGAELAQNPSPDVFRLGAEAAWSNTPTVTYQPLLGDRFTRAMLQPVPPSAVFQLLQGGWPADLVLRTVVSSINGLRNASLGAAAGEGFDELVQVLTRIQRAGGLGIRVEPRKDGSAIVMVLPRGNSAAGAQQDGRRVRELLGLAEDVSELEVVYGLYPRHGSEIAVLSRSMMELLLELGFGIELPQDHVTGGRVTAGRQLAGEIPAKPLVRIQSAAQAPTDAYAAVRYKDHWYWIDDTDMASKRIFTFMLILSSLAETGQSLAAPVVTVPSR